MTEPNRKKVWQTVQEMLKDRGYSNYRQLENTLATATLNKSTILVYFSHEAKINKQVMVEYIQLLAHHQADQGILIYNKEITPHVNGSLSDHGIKIQTFQAKELMINITKHEWVFPHVKTTKKEEEEIYQKYGKQLARIRHDDPVVRYYGWPEGTLIRIDTKPLPNYRLVVLGQKLQTTVKKRHDG